MAAPGVEQDAGIEPRRKTVADRARLRPVEVRPKQPAAAIQNQRRMVRHRNFQKILQCVGMHHLAPVQSAPSGSARARRTPRSSRIRRSVADTSSSNSAAGRSTRGGFAVMMASRSAFLK